MTGRTNTGGAASGGVKGAVIGAIFPEGATVSVSNGTKTYTSMDTDGNTAFMVEPGTWTVTAEIGEDSASESVTVQDGDWVSVELSFSLVLFDGADNAEITGGWTANGNNVSASSVSIANGILTFINKTNYTSDNGQWYCGPINKINITGYTRYAVCVESMTGEGYIGIGTVQSYQGMALSTSVANLKVSEPGTYELDISGVTPGEYFIGWGAYHHTNENHTWTFSLFELRP